MDIIVKNFFKKKKIVKGKWMDLLKCYIKVIKRGFINVILGKLELYRMFLVYYFISSIGLFNVVFFIDCEIMYVMNMS